MVIDVSTFHSAIRVRTGTLATGGNTSYRVSGRRESKFIDRRRTAEATTVMPGSLR
jgi:hypothetical protein